ncbi:MAG: recombinase family protein [Candidatus Andersenbacteria bacterium]|nr:recombinase family protein [Candidatus Andersenbacteria bacterium]
MINIFDNDAGVQKRAIAYYRHSAEDKQENSVPIQRKHAQRFAREHSITIIHEEADEGKTGLLADRPGFQRLFHDWIRNDQAPSFDYVLVYDVSRWGRFQDQDEAAYYEFCCKREGKQVIYISRGFPKEEQRLMSHLQTSIERYMAAEYSRQLSEKVFYGSAEVARQGYSAGGSACYGMQRLLLSVEGKPLRVLKRGEHKQIANERVKFAPAPDGTATVVKEIFRHFTMDGISVGEVVMWLNGQGIAAPAGGVWVRESVLRILRNETYTGTMIYNKVSNRLRQGRRRNPCQEWVICREAFPAVVEQQVFDEARRKLAQQALGWPVATLLERARQLFVRQCARFFERRGVPKERVAIFVPMLPITVSISAKIGDETMWCFCIGELMRQFTDILAIGVAPCPWPITFQRFFLIPPEAFGVSGVHTIFTGDQEAVPWEARREDVLAALEEMMARCEERFPWQHAPARLLSAG